MNDIAIRVDNLSKLYKIGTVLGGPADSIYYRTLRETIVDTVSSPFRRLSKN